MKRRMTITVVLGSALLFSGCSDGGGTGTQLAPGTRLIASLVPFDACDDLLEWFHSEGTKRVGPHGFPGVGYGAVPMMGEAKASATSGSAGALESQRDETLYSPQAGTNYSSTNVQEEGIDEADLVKTDGRRLVTVARNHLRVLDTSDAQPTLVGSVKLPGQWWNHQLLLHGDRVIVLANTMELIDGSGSLGSGPDSPPSLSMPAYPQSQSAVLAEVDISDPTVPQITSTLSVDGSQVSARSIGSTARVVIQSNPLNMGFVSAQDSSGETAATQTNRSIIENSTLENWLPSYTLDDQRPGGDRDAKGRLSACDRVSRPSSFSGFGTLSVLTIDLGAPLGTGSAVSVLTSGQNVYASKEHLFVATNRYSEMLTPADETGGYSKPTTEVHAFSITGSAPARYLASGQVKGTLLNQFSMSEHEGYLRVATTLSPVFTSAPMPLVDEPVSGVSAGVSESMVSVLAFDEGRLAQVGQVAGLGRTEQIYAVRFIGDRGYVVTFRQTDPLYVLDLSDPKAPAVSGELKIPGYSAYLHPVGDGLLLGLGQDATEQGRVQGTQLSLFDVGDPARPTRLHHLTLPEASSQAEYDHHAFLYWPATGLTVVPLATYASPQFVGAIAASVDRSAGIIEKGRVSQPTTSPWEGNIQRSLVIGERLYLVSEVGVLAVDQSSLATTEWIAYPPA